MNKSRKILISLITLVLSSCTINTNNFSSKQSSTSASSSSSSLLSNSTSATSSSTSTLSSSSSTSCSSSSSSSSSTSTSSSSSSFEYTSELAGKFNKDTPTTITFWHAMNNTQQAALDEIIAEFNKTELGKNISVSHEQIGNRNDVFNKVATNIGIGTTPNLVYCYPEHVAMYNGAHAVEELDSYISDIEYGFTEEERLGFVRGFYNEGRSYGDNKMYSLPFVKSSEVLYYDKNFFEFNNLSVPTTWDEMWEVCKKIKKINPDSTPLGYDSEANWFITNAEQRGYDYTTATVEKIGNRVDARDFFIFNNEGNKSFVKELKEYYDKGYFQTQGLCNKYMSVYYTSYTSNRAYMVIGSQSGASNYIRSDSETAIATLPQTAEGKKVKDAVISQGPSICMLSKEDKQEEIASWLFLKYLTTNIEAQVSFAKTTGYIPVSKLAHESELYKTYLEGANGTSGDGIVKLASKLAVAQSNMYFASPSFVGCSYASKAVGNLIVEVLKNGVEIETAFKNAEDNCYYNIV